MRPTIKDIAQRAGVSKTTVSFALNDPSRISSETYNRVMAVVRELDYVPNPVARTLTTKRLGALGLLLPQPLTEVLRNPCVVEMVRGVGELCAERELSLTMIPPIKGRVIEAARRAFVDGLITIGVGPDHEVVELLNNRHIPFVTVDGAETEATINVGIDDEAAAYGLMHYMLGLGHRRIAILELMPEEINRPEERFSLVRERRLAGFTRALAETGLSLYSPGIVIVPTESSAEGGRQSALPLLNTEVQDRPTAIVAMSDAMALGVYQACRELKLAIPADLSVAGFDDIPDASLISPDLTTVCQPSREKGVAAAQQLVSLLEGSTANHCVLPTQLKIRSSTRAPGSRG